MQDLQASPLRFRDRFDAGQRLAAELTAYANRSDVVVLALPRGGVPVACEVARALHAPLDVCVVRKLGAIDDPELAVGAIASGGVQLLNPTTAARLHIRPEELEEILTRERAELQRRETAYRGHRPPLEVRDKTVLLIDDGVATGSSMRAAIAALRLRSPARIVAAVPVAQRSVGAILEQEADSFVCVLKPADLFSVGQWYYDFSQTTDEEVRDLLDRAHRLTV